MKEMYDLKDKLQEELDEIARKPELTAGDLEHVHKLTDTIKNIDKICMMEEEGEYSQTMDFDMYGRGHSYAKRDRRGRYSRDDGMGGRRDGRGRYSRDGRSEMMEHLEMALDSADEKDREMIRRMIKQIENA